jgi:hypothetical protein
MNTKPTNGELMIMLENLTKNVEDGFKGIHERQDKTNGNVLKNTKFRYMTTAVVTFVTIIGIGNLVNIFIK